MISENKLRHSIAVARQCRDRAIAAGLPEEQQDALFVAGLLHDIGYEKLGAGNNISDHPKLSKTMIQNFLDYAETLAVVIGRHGLVQDGMNMYDCILNMADLTTDYNGQTISVETRLDGIKACHGEDSLHYKHAKQMAELLFT